MRRDRGFTLIELLVVVVIIGILASVLIPSFASSRERAFVATMKSDLRNLATAEEGHFYDFQTYTTDVSSLSGYAASRGVTIAVGEATMGGWSATASHTKTSRQCFLFVGSASPVGAATVEGEVNCN